MRRARDGEDVAKRRRCCAWLSDVFRGCCRRSPAAAAEPSDDGDVELGGGSSLLVAERVRMIQQPAEPPPPPPEPPTPGRERCPSIAERRAMLEKKTTPPPPPERTRSASAEKLRAMRSARAAPRCGFCGLDVFAAEAQRSRGEVYHAACFRCGACGKALAGVQWGARADDDLMYCDDLRLGSCLQKLKTRDLDHEREAANQRLSASDARATASAKLKAVEVIGDELEQLVSKLVPRCALCGGTFGASDRMVMQGMTKIHEACMRGAAPAAGAGASLTPKVALKDAPDSLLVKLSAGKVVTFFLAKVDDADEETVRYIPDPQSRAPHRRRVASAIGAGARCLSNSGRDVAPATTVTERREGDGPRLLAPFRWTSAGLDWSLDVELQLDGETLALGGAALRVRSTALV